MWNENQNRQGNQSQIDEGFIPIKNLIQQNLEIVIKKQERKIETKKQFVSRYITEGIMRKEPPQCYRRFQKFDFIQKDFKQPLKTNRIIQESKTFYNQSNENTSFFEKQKTHKISQKQKTLTPYDKYIASGDYNLVYSRSKDFQFSNDEPNFAANFVKLDCLKSKQQAKYKALRPFQFSVDKKQQSKITNLQRSSSLKESLLEFDSRFQSGNLLCAFKHKKQPSTYSLFIHNDTNTYGYNHWFYFSVKNAQPQISYRFNIVNFRKQHSFFREGNKPVVFSLIDSQKQGKSGYSKRGQKVFYGKSPITKSYDSKQKLFQLSFSLKFWNQNDVYYISQGLPYSYSKLLYNLNTFQQVAIRNKLKWTLQSLGTSIGGNSIPYVTINKFQDFQHGNEIKNPKSYRQPYQTISNETQQNKQQKKNKRVHSEQQKQTPNKKVIFLIARQHPGETWSSYLMDEFIHQIVSQQSFESKYLLKNFIIKCVPMINVDGVICGNFRCDLAGTDLNRNWRNPSQLLHPQIFSIKNQITNLTDTGYKIQTVFDLHGHSKEYNLFCYTCKTDNFECRLLPYLMSQYNKDFYFPFCTFGISRYKQTTARATVFNIIKNPNVLTIQSSLFGSKSDGKIVMFQPSSMRKMAQTMIKGCKSYFSHDENYFQCKEVIKERIEEFMSYKGQSANGGLSGSDSEPSGDQMDINQKILKIFPKNLANQYPEIKEMKKSAKKVKRKIKKEKFQVNQTRQIPKKEQPSTLNQIKSKLDIKLRITSKATKSNQQSFIAKKSQPAEMCTTTQFQTRSFIMSSKTINQDDFLSTSKQLYRDLLKRQDHKLAIFPRQKQGLIPLKLKNQSLQFFRESYNGEQRPRYQASIDDLKDKKRMTNKKITFYRDQIRKNQKEEFPLLCVMSQNRKKKQIQIMQNRRIESVTKSLSHASQSQKQKTAVQQRSEAIKQLRERNTKNAQLVSKIWKDNINRFGMGYSAFRIQD